MIYRKMSFNVRWLYGIILGVFITGLFLGQDHYLSAKDEGKCILVLNSYHKEFQWTDDQNEGAIKVLDAYSSDIVIYTEYLDWKRFADTSYINLLYDEFQYKYSGKKIDVIMTTDDMALNFALTYRDEIFSGAPIVFSGVYEEVAQPLIDSYGDLTGVFEKVDVDTTLQYALGIQQGAKEVYLLCEPTESGIAIEKTMRQLVTQRDPSLTIHSLSNRSFDEILEDVKTLPSNSIILVGPYDVDRSGEYQGGKKLLQRISEKSSAPVFVIYEHLFGTGAIGGSLLSGALEGGSAATLAIEILEGKSTHELAPISQGIFTPKFDYKVMTRYGISLDRLPENAITINRTTSFFERYRVAILSVATVFCVLMGYITVLLLNIRRRVRAEADLKKRNDEIQELYQVVTASEEELRQQYEEIDQMKNNLFTSEERYRLASEGSNDALWDYRTDDGNLHLSQRFYEMLGCPEDTEYSVKALKNLAYEEDYALFIKALKAHLAKKTDFIRLEMRLRSVNGVYNWFLVRGKAVWDIHGRAVRIAGSITDITERKKNEQVVESLAYFDILTGLPNRVNIYKQIDPIIKKANIEGKRLGLLFLDLDNFKYVNDTFGHSVGDQILKLVADELRKIQRDKMVVGRFGGDEFIILVQDTTPDEIVAIGDEIIKRFDHHLEIDGITQYITTSVGISIYPDHADNFEQLMQYADHAMYKAKAAGKTRCEIFDMKIHEELIEKMNLTTELRKAIENKDFVLYYQPQINLKTGLLTGMEALIRWNHPQYGIISPGRFIPIAEETGLIIEIGKMVVNQAAKFSAHLAELGFDPISISINVSIKEMMEKDYVADVIQLVRSLGVSPSQLTIEVTESVLIENFDMVGSKLETLRNAGFKVSLDDFGKGYSSLNYLKLLPIDTIKIDKSFVDDILDNAVGKSITVSIVQIAHQLGKKVLAEGVEEKEQYEYLRNENCDEMQGYYFSRPLTEEAMISLMEKHGQ